MKITKDVPCTKEKPLLIPGTLLIRRDDSDYVYLLGPKRTGDNVFAYIAFDTRTGAANSYEKGQFNTTGYKLFKGKLTLENSEK